MVSAVKFLGYTLFFIASLLYFLPKAALYYALEKELQSYKVIISHETTIDSGFALNIDDGTLSISGIESATFSHAKIMPLIIYNELAIEDIRLSSAAKSFIPLQIASVALHYTIINPLEVAGSAVGEFGEASFSFDILERNMAVTLKPSERMNREFTHTLRNLKREQNGEYSYVKKI